VRRDALYLVSLPPLTVIASGSNQTVFSFAGPKADDNERNAQVSDGRSIAVII
jgi:hypothetical protein